jgi:uncharacterized protein with HEPN domain
MSKRAKELFLLDILVAIEKIKNYTKDFTDKEKFLNNDLYFDATMRELEIIGEASKHLLNLNLLENDWRIVVDFRNYITHHYFGIDIDEIWEVIKVDIVEFEKVLYKLVKKIENTIFKQVIETTKNDFLKNENMINILNKILEQTC